MNSRQSVFAILLLCIATLFFSCENSQKKVDLSNVQIEVKALDFYKDFAKIDSQNIAKGLNTLKAKYPQFLDFYLDTLLPFGPLNGNYSQPLAQERIGQIFTFPDYKKLNDTVLIAFPQTDKITVELVETFKNIKYHLPNAVLPNEIIYFTSCLNQWTAITHETQLGIGLDMFLGKDFPPYRSIDIPDYALLRHTSEQIPVWAARAIYFNNFNAEQYDKSLLELMIQNGKEWYFLKKVLPDMPKEKLFGYTKEQMDWAEKNQTLIYNFFLRDNMLYDKSQQKIMRYVTQGPNSAGFPSEAPGNIGSYLGYKIVESYAKNDNKNLQELLKEKDAMSIFRKANYKP